MIYKLNTPYKEFYYNGCLIISRYIKTNGIPAYKVTSSQKYGYGCWGYSSTFYFSNLTTARKYVSDKCQTGTIIDLSISRIKSLTA